MTHAQIVQTINLCCGDARKTLRSKMRRMCLPYINWMTPYCYIINTMSEMLLTHKFISAVPMLPNNHQGRWICEKLHEVARPDIARKDDAAENLWGWNLKEKTLRWLLTFSRCPFSPCKFVCVIPPLQFWMCHIVLSCSFSLSSQSCGRAVVRLYFKVYASLLSTSLKEEIRRFISCTDASDVDRAPLGGRSLCCV